jgi:hypothetical protein
VEYIKRPSLDYFKRHNFLKGENVYSFHELYALHDLQEHRERTINDLYMIKRAVFEIEFGVEVLEREIEEEE